MFSVKLTLRTVIAGCPDSGLEALDWRRKHNLPERCDNRYTIEIKSDDYPEAHFRQLVDAGFKPRVSAHGDISIQETPGALGHSFDPDMNAVYGYCAVISPEDVNGSLADAACSALRSAFRAQTLEKAGGEKALVSEAEKLTAEMEAGYRRLAEIENILGECGINIPRKMADFEIDRGAL